MRVELIISTEEAEKLLKDYIFIILQSLPSTVYSHYLLIDTCEEGYIYLKLKFGKNRVWKVR